MALPETKAFFDLPNAALLVEPTGKNERVPLFCKATIQRWDSNLTSQRGVAEVAQVQSQIGTL